MTGIVTRCCACTEAGTVVTLCVSRSSLLATTKTGTIIPKTAKKKKAFNFGRFSVASLILGRKPGKSSHGKAAVSLCTNIRQVLAGYYSA